MSKNTPPHTTLGFPAVSAEEPSPGATVGAWSKRLLQIMRKGHHPIALVYEKPGEQEFLRVLFNAPSLIGLAGIPDASEPPMATTLAHWAEEISVQLAAADTPLAMVLAPPRGNWWIDYWKPGMAKTGRDEATVIEAVKEALAEIELHHMSGPKTTH